MLTTEGSALLSYHRVPVFDAVMLGTEIQGTGSILASNKNRPWPVIAGCVLVAST